MGEIEAALLRFGVLAFACGFFFAWAINNPPWGDK